MAEPSTAIVCIAMCEQPFAQEWLEYHLALGFEHIYYIITDPDFAVAHDFYAQLGFDKRVSWHRFNQQYSGWQLGAYSELRARCNEDWLLILDLDEFLYLPAGGSIGSYLAGLDDAVSQVQFPWLSAPLPGYLSSGVLSALPGIAKFTQHHVKSMARRRDLASIGVHKHELNEGTTILSSGQVVEPAHYHAAPVRRPAYYANYPYVLHACTRGHLDMLNRICAHRFLNANCGDGERLRLKNLLTGRPAWPVVPNRYLLLKALQQFPRVELNPNLPVLQAGTDREELLRIFLQQINKVVDFRCNRWQDIEAAFEARYLLDHKLSRLEINGFVDVDEQMAAPTQLDYVVKLRALIEHEQAGG